MFLCVLFKFLTHIIQTLTHYFLQFEFGGVDIFCECEILGGNLVDAELLHAVDVA